MNNANLLRSNIGRKDLISALGFSLKETRVTGFLGYLLSYRPKKLLEKLGIDDNRISSVLVERKLDTKRCDIIVETADDVYVIEAKLFYENPIDQILRQEREIKTRTKKKLHLIGITNNTNIKHERIHLYSWKDIFAGLSEPDNNKVHFLYEELKMHLENNGLVNTSNYDIYAREVGDERSLNTFLKCQVYYCNYMKSSNIEKCRYFAPHFGKKIIRISPGINYGISYLAQIQNIEYADNTSDLRNIIMNHIKKEKLKSKYPDCVAIAEGIDFELTKPLIVLCLNSPHLLFNPPIQKDKLQDGSGWLSKQYFTFEEFFCAANI